MQRIQFANLWPTYSCESADPTYVFNQQPRCKCITYVNDNDSRTTGYCLPRISYPLHQSANSHHGGLLMKCLLTLIILTAAVAAQTVPVTDGSVPGSPISLRGTITFGTSTVGDCSVTGHNNSNRMIVAYVFDLRAVLPDGQPYRYTQRHDHFFKDEAMVNMASPYPNLDFDASLECGDAPFTVRTAQPQATIEVKFVQFDDGSTWGDDAAVQNVMLQRKETLEYMNLLKAAYVRGGSSALDASLHQPPVHQHGTVQVLAKRQILLDLNDTPAAAKMIDEFLTSAQTHASWLK
jgi:hypothetical protein